MNYSVRDLVDTTAKSFEPLAMQKDLEFRIINNVPKTMISYGDPFMIREIYSNIISNAIKYTFDGYVIVSIDFKSDESMLVLSVKDTGVGIAEEHHMLIFEEFEQISPDSMNSYAKGSGLGLAITKGLVKQLEGDIRFESERGLGTEFIVELPISISESEDVCEDDKPVLNANLGIEGISVLLVDDDSIQLTMASAMLSTQGVKVSVESNPNNVLNIIKETTFDLIFLDIQMPEVNGFNLLKRIFDSGVLKGKTTPIIALTATSNLELKDYQESGFSDFLNKPYDSSQLFDAISRNLKQGYNNSTYIEISEPKGVETLINYVKEDKESSLAILNAFVDECTTLNNFLKDSNKQLEFGQSSNLSHKMIPIFKMMEDRSVTSNLLELERTGTLSDKELRHTIDRVDFYIEQAKELISKK